MNFDVNDINIIIAALRQSGMVVGDQAAKNAKLIGKASFAESQRVFARDAFALADKIERQARAQGMHIHISGH